MKAEINYNLIANWTDTMLAKGRYSFALSELKEKNPAPSDLAIKFALKRLTDKGKLLSIFLCSFEWEAVPPGYPV